ncbi:cysteine--tRNA ligase [Calderihabitans maritimus]|uniref:cysteine--tRNA ligase n=1 Tax=Calderihabitans maritimus TaxID=1246530 RepID=UPI000B5013E2
MKVYNTLTKRKEEFIPRRPPEVTMYVCGPTTYNFIHLGNARPLVVFDTIRRYLQYKGFKLTYVQNFTDIDDKIINRAREENIDALELASRFIQEYYRDADALNVRRADIHPKVSEHIPEIIAMIERLIEKGYAYVVEGNVYFSVRKFPDYGKLSGRSVEELMSGVRIEVDARKKDPLDFALWKAARPGEPAWDSPWGKGRPGWHIECSAMSLKYLGNGFDIHGGGNDLIFPHHENEIAQSEAYTGEVPFVRYWLHNGFITVNQEKMSKSSGNFFLVREVLEKYNPDVVRFYLLSTHYRSPLDFDEEKLNASKKGLERIKSCLSHIDEILGKQPGTSSTAPEVEQGSRKLLEFLSTTRTKFEQAMDDDFNTALAIAALFELCREVNSYINHPEFEITSQTQEVLRQTKEIIITLGEEVLGILPDLAKQKEKDTQQEENITKDLLELILEIRQDARRKKDWATADHIRDRLKELGVLVEDTPHGPRWKWAKQT